MVARPISLDEWRLRRGLTYRGLGELIGCRVKLAFAYCQDPGTDKFNRPGDVNMARIYVITDGDVQPNSFYRLPKLTQPFDPNAPQLPLEAAA